MNDFSLEDYTTFLPANVKEKLEQLRNIIKNVLPEANEVISYGMPAFKQGKVLVYYAGYKNHIGFYPTSKPIIHFEKELLKYKTSKGAIHFPLDKPLPVKLIEKIVKYRLQEVKNEMLKVKKATIKKTSKSFDSKKMLDLIKVADGILHTVPDDMKELIATNSNILEKWNNLTPIQRNEWICWVTIVKKHETREEHINRMLKEIEEGIKKPCCWPGCPHRNPNSRKWIKE